MAEGKFPQILEGKSSHRPTTLIGSNGIFNISISSFKLNEQINVRFQIFWTKICSHSRWRKMWNKWYEKTLEMSSNRLFLTILAHVYTHNENENENACHSHSTVYGFGWELPFVCNRLINKLHKTYDLSRMLNTTIYSMERAKEKGKIVQIKNFNAHTHCQMDDICPQHSYAHTTCVYCLRSFVLVCVYNFNVFLCFFGCCSSIRLFATFLPHSKHKALCCVAFNMTFSLLYDWNKHHSLSVGESEKEEQRHACVCVRSNTHKRTNVSIQTNKTFESIHTVNKAHEKPSYYLSNLVVVLCLILSVYPSLSLFWCYSFSLSLMHIRRTFDIFSVNRMSLHFQPSRFNIHSQHKVAIFGGSFVLCVRYFSLMLVSHILVASIRSRSHFDWQSCVYAIPSKSRVHFAEAFFSDFFCSFDANKWEYFVLCV